MHNAGDAHDHVDRIAAHREEEGRAERGIVVPLRGNHRGPDRVDQAVVGDGSLEVVEGPGLSLFAPPAIDQRPSIGEASPKDRRPSRFAASLSRW